MSRLEKSKSNKWILGVCGGLGKHLGIDATILRVLFVAAVWFLGSGLMVYLLLAVFLPKEQLNNNKPPEINKTPVIDCNRTNCEYVKSQGNKFCSGCGRQMESIVK